MGSKRGIAKEILPIILKDRVKGQSYVEPFCGGCNSLSLVENPRVAADSNKELIAMYKAGQRGWIPPEYISEEDYYRLKNGEGSPELRAYAGFTHSFGAVYFAGYARYNDGRIGYAAKNVSGVVNSAYIGVEERRKFIVDIQRLRGVKFVASLYDDLRIPKNSLIYCDPPYAASSGYAGGGNFNSSHFWLWAEQKAREGHTVFVSEYSAPSFAKEVWSKRKDTQLSRNGNGIRIEKLFKL